MTKDTTTHDDKEDHRKVYESLPWYVNGTLRGQRLEMLETHVASCSTCQKALAEWQTVAAITRAQENDTWSPSAKHFSRALQKIKAGDRF